MLLIIGLILLGLAYIGFGAGVADEFDEFVDGIGRPRKMMILAAWPIALLFILGMIAARTLLMRIFGVELDPPDEPEPDEPDEPDEIDPPKPMPKEKPQEQLN